MALCSDCSWLSIDDLRLVEVPWKKDLAELIDSAEDGCPLCLLCWTGFQKDCGEDIQKHLKTIVNGEQGGRDLQIYMACQFSEAEYDQDRAYCDGRRFSPCEIEVRIGPGPVSHDEFFELGVLRVTQLDVFAEPGMHQSTRG